MKKAKLFVLLAAAGLVLSACNDSKNLPLDYNPEDLTIDTPWVDYRIPATDIKFDEGEDNLTLKYEGEGAGESHEYKCTITPNSVTKADLTWTSSNENVVTVDKGKVTATGPGSATITVGDNADFFEEVTLNVTVVSPLKGLSLGGETIQMDINDSKALDLVYNPVFTTETAVTWTSDHPNVVAVDDFGVLTTGEVEGDATITVTSTANSVPQISASVEVHVEDRTNHVASIVLSAETHEVEVGKTLVLAAEVKGEQESIAPTHPELTFSSGDSEKATVKLDSGVITVSAHAPTAKDTTLKVWANAVENNVKSNEVGIVIYEVLVDEIKNGDITLDFETGLTKDVDISYSTVRSDNDQIKGENNASLANFSLTVKDTNVAKVVDGKIVAVAAGNTQLTIKDLRTGVSKDVKVVVDYSIISIKVNEKEAQVKVGNTITFTATTDPVNVPSSLITWSSSDESIATINEKGVLTAKAVGTVQVSASVSGHASSPVNVTVNRPVTSDFEYGNVYLVGNADFSSGIATGGPKESPDVTSWGEATKAYLFTDVKDPDPAFNEVYKIYGEVVLREGDEFKIRYDADQWLDPYDVKDEQIIFENVHYEKAGAIANGDILMPESDNGNLVVKTTGLYEIYYKVYEDGYRQAYIALHQLHVDKNTIYLKPEGETTIAISSWNGTLKPLTIPSEDAGKITVSKIDDHGHWTVTAGSSVIDGYATIIIEDDVDTIYVHVYVSNVDVDTEFKEGQPYVVGNKSYVGGVSNSGVSWGDASLAYKMTSKTPDHDGITAQWEAVITFEQGDEWKFRVGDIWPSVDNFENDGALATGDVVFTNDKDGNHENIKVVTPGTYTIQCKQYGTGDDVTYGGYISNISEKQTVTITAQGLDNLPDWVDDDSASLFIWNDTTKENALGAFDTCGGNIKSGSVSFTMKSGVTYDRFIFFVYEQSVVKQTINMVCDIDEAGNYTLTIGEFTWEGDKIDGGVTLTKGSGGETTKTYAIHYTNDGVAWGDSTLVENEGVYKGELLLADNATFCINMNGTWLHFDALDESSPAKDSFEDAGLENNHDFKCVDGDTYLFEVSSANKVTITLKSDTVHKLVLASLIADVTVYGEDAKIVILDKTPDSTVSIKDISDETKVEATIEDNKVVIHALAATDSVIVTVTDGTVDVEVEVAVSPKVVTFEKGTGYVVGDHAYNTGTSSTGVSWGDPTLANKMTLMDDPDTGVTKEWHTSITFAANDEWKLRYGPDDSDYLPLENIEWNGALFTGDMVLLKDGEDKYTNIKVVTPGTYDIYFKQYGEGALATYGAYISNLTEIHEVKFTALGLENITWRNDGSESLYLWLDDDTPVLGSFDSCNGNLAESGSITAKIVDGQEIAGAIFFFWQDDIMFKTEDIAISITESGDYKVAIASTLNIDAEPTEGVKTIHDGIEVAERLLTLAADSATLNVGGGNKEIAIVDKAATGDISVTSKDTSKVTAALNGAGDKVILTPVAETTDPVKVEVKQGDVTREILVTVNASTPETVTVTLKSSADVGMGNRLYMVGDFSDWKINDNAIAFEWKADHWEATVTVEEGTVYSYKLVKGLYEDPAESPTGWESDPNRNITFDTDGETIVLEWH